MNEILCVQPGDKVCYMYGGIWGGRKIATVTKVTPTGRIRVDLDEGKQFDKYGRLMGNNYSDAGILKLTPELEDEILQEEVVKEVLSKIKVIKKLDYVTAVGILSALSAEAVRKESEEKHERLTVDIGTASSVGAWADNKDPVYIAGRLCQRLAEYEAIGLSPGQIKMVLAKCGKEPNDII